MRRLKTRYIVISWLLLPVLAIVFHYNKGIEIDLNQRVEGFMDDAARAYEAKDYDKAKEILDQAKKEAEELPEYDVTQIELRKGLAMCKAGELLDASKLLTEALQRNEALSDPQLLDALREALGTAFYYDAWYMRIQGYERNYWEPVADHSRRLFKSLAVIDQQEMNYAKNVENALRLMRMDLQTLKDKEPPEEVQESQKKNDKGDPRECKQGQDGQEGGDGDQEGEGEGKSNKSKRKKPGQKGPQKGDKGGDIRDKEDPAAQGGYGAPDLRGS